MSEKNFYVADKDGERLDVFLVRQQPELSRAHVQKLIASGDVVADGKIRKANFKLKAGMQVAFVLPEAEPIEVKPEDIPLDILYEDGDIIVINKARGMVVHPAAGHEDGTLVNALLHHCGDSLSGIGGEKRPGIVHRIDKDTSGLIISAKNDFTHIGLSSQLSDHSLFRIYEGIVRGHMKESSGTVNAPIGRSTKDRKKMAVNYKNGKEAVTHWSVLEEFAGYSHLRCQLETGRTHQIRVHMAYLGHPLLGDAT